jgi:MFS family permease
MGGPTLAVILVVAVPLSVLRSFFMAGCTAAVPDLVGRPLVTKANSLLEAIYSTGYIAGPAVAGGLASAIGPGPTLAIDATSFALPGLGLAFIAVYVTRDLAESAAILGFIHPDRYGGGTVAGPRRHMPLDGVSLSRCVDRFARSPRATIDAMPEVGK